MNNLYLIKKDDYLINSKSIDDLRKKYSSYTYIKIDYEEDKIKDILYHLDVYDLLNPNKFILVREVISSSLLESKDFLKYLDNPNSDHILILEVDRLSKKYKGFKTLEKKNDYEVIDDALGSYKMDYKTRSELLKCSDNNLILALKSLENIKAYKNKAGIITLDDINDIAIKDINLNIFNLSDALMRKDLGTSLVILKDLVINKEMDELYILNLLKQQFRLLLLTKNLSYSELEGLKINPYRLKKIKEYNDNYENKEILKMLSFLSTYDLEFKSGKNIGGLDLVLMRYYENM